MHRRDRRTDDGGGTSCGLQQGELLPAPARVGRGHKSSASEATGANPSLSSSVCSSQQPCRARRGCWGPGERPAQHQVIFLALGNIALLFRRSKLCEMPLLKDPQQVILKTLLQI